MINLKKAKHGLSLLPKKYRRYALINWYKHRIIPTSVYIRLKETL